jgi:hypothetical protein
MPQQTLRDYWSSDEDGDHDIALTHDGNSMLHEPHKVKTLFGDAREHQSMADLKTRKWISSLPFDMAKEAILLFSFRR